MAQDAAVPVSFFYGSAGQQGTGQPQEMHTDITTQVAGMERKQHKRGNISKQHKSRENNREMISNVSYKTDTMSQRQVAQASYKSDSLEVTSVH